MSSVATTVEKESRNAALAGPLTEAVVVRQQLTHFVFLRTNGGPVGRQSLEECRFIQQTAQLEYIPLTVAEII